MARMSKSFLFYLKYWDILEKMVDDKYSNLFEDSSKDIMEKRETITERADEYQKDFFSRITEKITGHIENHGFFTHKVKHNKAEWEQYVFIGRNSEEAKEKKWNFSFYIEKYKSDMCFLFYICRWRGPTKALKPELDKIFENKINPESDNSLNQYFTYLFVQKLPSSDYNAIINDDEIIKEIFDKTKKVLTKKNLKTLLAIK
jgi:hypothetical protein